MEIHKPKLPHNWNEFLKEYGIIVLGVLTALFFEQAVGSLEWRHKVSSAVADMNDELSSGDGPQAYVRVAMHDCLATRLDEVRASVESGDRTASRKAIEAVWLPKRTWDSLAREAANASDVASHMPHDRMLKYRIAYEMVPDLQRLADKELADLGAIRALPASGGSLETMEKLAELNAVEALQLDNDTIARESTFVLIRLKMIPVSLDKVFVDRSLNQARLHYAGCLTAPHVPSVAGASSLQVAPLE